MTDLLPPFTDRERMLRDLAVATQADLEAAQAERDELQRRIDAAYSVVQESGLHADRMHRVRLILAGVPDVAITPDP